MWVSARIPSRCRGDQRANQLMPADENATGALEEQLDREPIVMRHRDFTTRYEPEFVRQGFRVIYPQPSGVHEKELEGWTQAKIQDARGRTRPAAIGDNPQAIELIPRSSDETNRRLVASLPFGSQRGVPPAPEQLGPAFPASRGCTCPASCRPSGSESAHVREGPLSMPERWVER